MNRRRFIVAGAAALAFSRLSTLAQVVDPLEGKTYTSSLTDAVLDLGETSYELQARYFHEEEKVEFLAFSNTTSSASVRFMPAGTDPEQYMEKRVDEISEQMLELDVIATSSFHDGGWVAMSVTNEGGIERGIYIEIQLGAFPEYDLEVFFTSDNEQLLANLEQVQQVTLADVEPFLFLDESGALKDLFE